MQTLRRGDEFALIRAKADGARSTSLLLSPVMDEPPAWTLRRLEHELALASELDAEWAVRPLALARHNGRIALALDDPGGELLSARLGRPMDVEQFLLLAISIAQSLRQVHARGLIHKDITPDNILVNGAGHVRLMGFGLASRLPRERHLAQPPQLLAGTLAYMAPEQTGRINRSVDARSDLYAIGVVFYQMLTGRLPFAASDPLEWVHCHVARRPLPPGELAPIPRPIADIVMKLLAKTAEERYQTAVGLELDLQRCLASLQRNGEVEAFPLGQHDAPDRLSIPEQLYGREREAQALQDGYRRMLEEGRPAWILVSGYAGIGKSAVVNEFHRSIPSNDALYAAGKFDQYKRNVPYAAVAQAFASLIRQLLGRGQAEIDAWRAELLVALGASGQVIANLVPEVELIIGKQSPAPEVPPEHIAARFRRIFSRFLGVFARAEHPLILFFDDLHWVDPATLDLLGYLPSEPAVTHLLLIGAYRDNEVDTTHPLRRRLDAMRSDGVDIEEIVLGPLGLDDVSRMIADSLRCRSQQVEGLSRLVFAKTGGNPFFASQFLTSLEAEGLLTFDRNQASWRWDLAQIGAKGFTDNVAHLLAGKLTRLPARTQHALQRLAALGDAADAPTLAMILESSEDSIETTLREAVAAGLLIHVGDLYRFVHDRVQETAYALIPEPERSALHLRIGRTLWSRADEAQIEDRVFDIVDQLDRGTQLLTDATERRRVAEINLRAGRRARQSMAYGTAMGYLRVGRSLLPENCWDECYELTFALELTLGECEYASVELASAEARLAALVTRAVTLRDSADVAAVRMTLYQNLSRTDRAVDVCLEYLERIGVHWSATPTRDVVIEEYAELWRRLGDREIEDLIHLPTMSDRDQQGTLDVLASTLAPALRNRNLFHLVIGRMANLSLEHGNSDGSTLAYVYLNTVIGEEYGDYRKGYRFGKLAVDLVEKGFSRFAHSVEAGFGATVIPWTKPVRLAFPWILRSIDTSLERGNLTFAAYSHYLLTPFRLLLGDPLQEVQQEAESALEFVRKIRFEFVGDIITVNGLYVQRLRGAAGAGSFERVDERSLEQRLEQSHFGNGLCWFWIRKFQACFLAEDFAGAILAEAQARRHFRSMLTVLEEADYPFYAALLLAATDEAAGAEERATRRNALLQHSLRLNKIAADCPENFAQRASLVAAEIARLERRDEDAQRLYEESIRAAASRGLIHDEAIAHETAARFYAARGLHATATSLLRSARSCYQRWGATAKVQSLDRQHPYLLPPARLPASDLPAPPLNLDVVSVVKAAQALSSEIVLDKLIEALLVVAVEHAGADRGALILLHNGSPRLEAEARSGRDKVEVILRRGAVAANVVPQSVLNYVIRTSQAVILGDTRARTSFATDDYLQSKRPRSVLCQPLITKGKLVGALYLENRLTPDAFSAERTAVLDVVGAQAAISLENALLYADLRDRERRIRRLVESNIIGVCFWSSDGTITDANDAFLDLLGYSREDLAAERITWSGITPPEYQHVDQRIWEQFRLEGTVTPYEKEYLRKDGSRVPALSGYTLLEESEERGVTFVMDLTERKQAELERSARRIAEAANQAKSEFLASMSHELRTPLHGILGYAQILERDPAASESQRDGIAVIRRSGEHLLSLIDDLLDLAKIEAGKLDLHISSVRLLDFLHVIREIVRIKAREKGLNLICDLGRDLPACVSADERRLRQILLNLLANAVKFTDRGYVRLLVQRLPGDAVRFEVRDCGVGIPHDQLGRLFQPFQQFGDAQRRSSGTGLGLAISQQLVRTMGGEIRVQSQPGEGSRFWFDLHLPSVPDAQPAVIGSRSWVTGYRGARKTVLVVDDMPENRKVLIALLAPLGFATAEAETGREALERVATVKPDLIITDLAMPVMDGLAATRQLRRDPSLRQVPVIVLSVRTSSADEDEALASGADAFVAKPVEVDRLLDVIARLLNIEWTSITPAAGARIEGDTVAPLVIPPAEDMATLHELAREGNMRKITQWAELLAASDARYGPFADQLCSLAKQYQSRAILRLAEEHVLGGGGERAQ